MIAIGCGGDDASTPAGEDASFDDSPGQIDVSVPIIDSGKGQDSGADANDGAPVCLSAPDAAFYGENAIDAGAQTITAHGCKGCHTADLSGNPDASIGGQYPKNLTPDLATGLGCWTDDEIARAVLVGIDDQGVALCVMPKFASTIGDGGITDVVAFLRSLPAVSKDIPDTMCPTDGGVDAD